LEGWQRTQAISNWKPAIPFLLPKPLLYLYGRFLSGPQFKYRHSIRQQENREPLVIPLSGQMQRGTPSCAIAFGI